MMQGYEPPLEEVPILSDIEIHARAARMNNGFEDRKRGNSMRVAPERHEHLFKSGPLGKCDDPLCTTCPAYYFKASPEHSLPGVAVSGQRKRSSALKRLRCGVINPHTKFMRRWNKIFVISCFIGAFLDPLFFFSFRVDKTYKCILIDQTFSTVMVVLRTISDSIYFLHILLQFRLAYVVPSVRGSGEISESRSQRQQSSPQGFATRDLVDDPKMIAWKYVKSWFIFDLITVLPLPQIMIKVVLPRLGGANYLKDLVRVVLLLQYLPRIVRILPVFSGDTPTGFIFETAWANFVINLLLYLLAAHVVGSCWYLFALQRVNRCLHSVCRNTTINCTSLLDCSRQNFNPTSKEVWKNDLRSNGCLQGSSSLLNYGIYKTAVAVTTTTNSTTRYVYAVFWGFQQISTLCGNQMPSLFTWEVLFVMGVIGLGLLLLTLLIGNMQNFLQSLGRRSLEMQLRRYEVEKWMIRRHLPLHLRRRVRQYGRFDWAATRGVNEDELLRDLPEDLHMSIRRLLFTDLVKKVRLLELMDEQLLDAIFQRLHQKLYIYGCEILRRGAPVDRMLFIVHGNLRSEGEDGSVVSLHGGDFCGEELLTWCIGATVDQSRTLARGSRAVSSRTVICESNVEAFSLEASDLEEVTRDFDRLLKNPRVMNALRHESHFWRTRAATTIQCYWRYKKKKLGNASSIPRSSNRRGTRPKLRHRNTHI